MNETQLPRWGARARDVFRALIGLYFLEWLASLVMVFVDLVLDTDIHVELLLGWLEVIRVGLAAAAVVSGAVWLVGAAVGGYRDST